VGERLAGRRALVTGGGQGVGRGIALALAAEGARLALLGRTRAKLEAVAREIEERGGEATPVVADLCVTEELERAAGEASAALGGLDVLVNNAVVYSYGRLLDVPPDVIEAAWQSGPRASLLLMRACHPALARGGGVIVNLGSGASHLWDPSGLGVYAATKAAIVSLTRTAAVEWAADGIRAYCVMPAAEGPAHEAWKKLDPEGYQATLSRVPLRRFGDPERDVGRVVAFLCSDDAAYTTGMIVPVDGGSTWIS
jgi:NAD(P)-dependent dehydrogenase (short-subunit alcohol dehydrogenase family)